MNDKKHSDAQSYVVLSSDLDSAHTSLAISQTTYTHSPSHVLRLSVRLHATRGSGDEYQMRVPAGLLDNIGQPVG